MSEFGTSGWLDREQYTRVLRQLLYAEPGDRFRVRYFCPMAKQSEFDRDAYVVSEGELTEIDKNLIKFDADGRAAYGSRAGVKFKRDDGAMYSVRLSVSGTPVVRRYQKKSNRRTGWVRQSRAVTDAEVID